MIRKHSCRWNLWQHQFEAKIRAANAAAQSGSTAAKRVRATHRAAKKTPIEALLSVESGLRTIHLSLDKFRMTFEQDPFSMDPETLNGIRPEDIPMVVFLADREGSQTLVAVAGVCHFKLLSRK